MNVEIVTTVINILKLCIVLSVSISVLVILFQISKYFDRYLNYKFSDSDKEFQFYKAALEYSNAVLSDTRGFATELSLLRFREYKDNHDMSKVTRGNLSKLVQDICLEINASIVRSNIDFSKVIFTEKYYDRYIIQTSFSIVKDLFEKDLNISYYEMSE